MLKHLFALLAIIALVACGSKTEAKKTEATKTATKETSSDFAAPTAEPTLTPEQRAEKVNALQVELSPVQNKINDVDLKVHEATKAITAAQTEADRAAATAKLESLKTEQKQLQTQADEIRAKMSSMTGAEKMEYRKKMRDEHEQAPGTPTIQPGPAN